MPYYEYGNCPDHNTIEVFQSMKDEPLTLCPECQKEGKETPIKRLISLSSFQLQGQGWARDNYSSSK